MRLSEEMDTVMKSVIQVLNFIKARILAGFAQIFAPSTPI